jgi:hypothetical protein
MASKSSRLIQSGWRESGGVDVGECATHAIAIHTLEHRYIDRELGDAHKYENHLIYLITCVTYHKDFARTIIALIEIAQNPSSDGAREYGRTSHVKIRQISFHTMKNNFVCYQADNQ